MRNKILTGKDKVFLSLFLLGWLTISYSVYKVIGIKSGEETISVVSIIKDTISNYIT